MEPPGAARVELRYDGDALWMSQAQMASLFGRDVSVISRHISAILEEGELDEDGSLQKLQTTSSGGRPATVYSLDMVISVGYRVSSAQATQFRRWATDILVRFATSGFVVDAERLKAAGREGPGQPSSATLSAISGRQRQTSMRKFDTSAPCVRIMIRNPTLGVISTGTSRPSSATQSQIKRPPRSCELAPNADEEHMGLRQLGGDRVTSADVTTAKNFLGAAEIRELNRLTDLLLTIFEDQLDLGRLTTMAQATKTLETQLQAAWADRFARRRTDRQDGRRPAMREKSIDSGMNVENASRRTVSSGSMPSLRRRRPSCPAPRDHTSHRRGVSWDLK
jgi:hypothetical protein